MQFFKNEYEAFRLQQIRCFFPFVLMYLLYSVLIGFLFVNVNYICFGSNYLWSPFFKILSFVLGFSISFPVSIHKFYRDLSYEDFLVALDMNFSQSQSSPFMTSYTDSEEMLWKNNIFEFIKQFRDLYVTRFKKLSINLLLVLSSILISSYVDPSLILNINKGFSSVSNTLFRGFYLEIEDGLVNEKDQGEISLSSSGGLELNLLENNLIKITARGKWEKIPSIRFESDGINKEKQVFQMLPVFPSSSSSEAIGYELSFTAEKSGVVFIPILSSSPIARLNVKKLPIPEVRLTAIDDINGVLSDEEPLELSIKAIGKNPLAKIKLKIDVAGKQYEELVSDILIEDKFEYDKGYSLVLENYMQSDFAKVHISAVAIDRNIPNALIGESNVISLSAASAYGRYQQTLNYLREIKARLDEAISGDKEAINEEMMETLQKSIQMSYRSPFFDGLDRHDLNKIQSRIKSLKSNYSTEQLLDASEGLNSFLFEHESIDDRERDRDFFVAARSLSRLIETPKDLRSISVESFNGRLSNFLVQRQKRWKLRIDYLSDPNSLKFLNRSKDNYFIKKLSKVTADAEGKAKSSSMKALKKLTVMTAEYRDFIEDLERVEDKDRKSKDQKRQQGIANARDKLRELQKRQGKISSVLDNADKRKKSDIEGKWPSSRMDQNANIKNTKSLEAEMRSLSPRAAERIKAAWKSMEMVLQASSQGDFTKAETASDVAGRLLRKADSAARKDQKKKRQRGKRKRSQSNKYYGNQIVGGDIAIQREYNVDRRYREDIIEEVQRNQDTNLDTEDQQLLDNYLRQVIR